MSRTYSFPNITTTRATPAPDLDPYAFIDDLARQKEAWLKESLARHGAETIERVIDLIRSGRVYRVIDRDDRMIERLYYVPEDGVPECIGTFKTTIIEQVRG